VFVEKNLVTASFDHDREPIEALETSFQPFAID
jgi:hypothetical protein